MKHSLDYENKKINSGFTLIELVVSLAIFGIVIIIAGGLMIASANSYSGLSGSVSLSQASKQALEQFSENSIDSSAAVVGGKLISDDTGTGDLGNYFCFLEYNGNVSVNGNTLKGTAIESGDAFLKAEKLYDVRVYYYDTSGTDSAQKGYKLYYGELSGKKNDSSLQSEVEDMVKSPNSKMELLCDHISSFNASVNTQVKNSDKSGDTRQVRYIKNLNVKMSLKRRGKQFDSESSSAFRGRTVYVDTFSTLASTPYKEEINDR